MLKVRAMGTEQDLDIFRKFLSEEQTRYEVGSLSKSYANKGTTVNMRMYAELDERPEKKKPDQKEDNPGSGEKVVGAFFIMDREGLTAVDLYEGGYYKEAGRLGVYRVHIGREDYERTLRAYQARKRRGKYLWTAHELNEHLKLHSTLISADPEASKKMQIPCFSMETEEKNKYKEENGGPRP